jgi:hypothetical protein
MQLKYWNPRTGVPQSLRDMLAHTNGNGSCIAWSQLFHQTLKAQGIAGSQIFMITPNTTVNPGATGFLVKNWNFGHHIRTGNDGVCDTTSVGDDIQLKPVGQGGPPNDPCIGPGPNGALNSTPQGDDQAQDGLFAGTHYPYLVFDATGQPDGDVANQPGVEGQGNPEPPESFRNHWVVKIGSQVYDPSYGIGPYPSEVAHENAAIDGISAGSRVKKNDAAQELQYTRDTARE